VFYRVVSGDTTAGVATAFRVTPQELAEWNALDAQARLEPGMSLQVFVAKNADLSKVMHVPEAHAKILVAGSAEFFDYFEGQNGKKRLMIVARQGDTLNSIGKRYGMTVGQMERVNRRGRTDQIAARSAPWSSQATYSSSSRAHSGCSGWSRARSRPERARSSRCPGCHELRG
jgi:membrane-bound lytic murein transglycosylase D